MADWCVLHVKTGTELDIAGSILLKLSLRAKVPAEDRPQRRLGRWRSAPHIFFPGYVFVSVPQTPEDYYTIQKIPGVLGFLGGGNPLTVPPEQMLFVNALWRHGNTPGNPSTVWTLSDGSHALTGGPLSALNPTIIRYDRRHQRATLRIRLFHREHTVTITAPEI